jgi:hypothetical protein
VLLASARGVGVGGAGLERLGLVVLGVVDLLAVDDDRAVAVALEEKG